MPETAGRLEAIWRFPIKSFQGESIRSTTLQANGIFGDRPLALAEKATGKVVSGKHKQLGERILEFEARYASEPGPGEPLPPVVATVDGRECRTDDPAAFTACCSEALGVEVELVVAGGARVVYETWWPEVEGVSLSDADVEIPLALAEEGSFADLEPLHVLTTASLEHLAALAPESRIATARFRPSLLVDTGDATGFVENEWVGRTATLGEATLEFGAVAPRCVMTTRPQDGLPRDIGVLRTLARENLQEFMGMQMACLGIYAKLTRPGRVSVGDRFEFV